MADDPTPPEQTASDEAPRKPYHDYHQQEADKHQQQALVDAQIADDVLHNPRYDEFFARFQPTVRQEFVRDYVSRRHFWTAYGNFYERHLTGQLTQFEQEAYGRLWDIQQKKLFDLQCEWRAELVTVPGVQTSADFEELSGHIENCAVIPPITPAELDMYLDWVRQADYAEDLYDRWGMRYGWQGYEDIKAQLDPEEEDGKAWVIDEVSPWYEFHNLRTGNGRLLRLPDLRGQKEKRYLDAWRADNKAQRETQQAQAAAAPPPDPRPAHLYGDDAEALRYEFARQFESAEVNRQRTAYETAHPPGTWEDEALDEELDFLKDLDEPVPIEAGPDWRLAVRQASYAYRKQKLLANLPLAYEAYCQRREWGIAQPPVDDDESHNVADWLYDALLKGRELLGEPRDFNF